MHWTSFLCDGPGCEVVVRGRGFRSTFSWRDGKRGISPSSVGVLLIPGIHVPGMCIYIHFFIIRHLPGVMENVEVFDRGALCKYCEFLRCKAVFCALATSLRITGNASSVVDVFLWSCLS